MSKKKGKKKLPKPEPSVLAGTLTVPRDEELIGRAVAPPAGRGMTRVEQLISEGASPDAKDTKGNPAINNAARKGHFSIVQTLRRAGADIEAPNPSGRARFACHPGLLLASPMNFARDDQAYSLCELVTLRKRHDLWIQMDLGLELAGQRIPAFFGQRSPEPS